MFCTKGDAGFVSPAVKFLILERSPVRPPRPGGSEPRSASSALGLEFAVESNATPPSHHPLQRQGPTTLYKRLPELVWGGVCKGGGSIGIYP